MLQQLLLNHVSLIIVVIFDYCLDCTTSFQKQFSFVIKVHRKRRNGYSATKIKLESIKIIERMRNSLWQGLIFESGYCLKPIDLCFVEQLVETSYTKFETWNRIAVFKKSFHFHLNFCEQNLNLLCIKMYLIKTP